MPETKTPAVRIEELQGGRLARVVIEAGRGNVLGRAELAAFRALLPGLAERRELRALLLEPAGPHFSFGASVPEHTGELVAGMLAELHALARELLALDLPLVAAVRGKCLGGGLELALLADRIVAAPDAAFAQPEIALAVFAPIGSALLPRVVGPRAAADLLLTGRSIDAAEARALGLVAEIADDPGAAAVEWVERNLCAKSAAALRLATRAARRAWVPAFVTELAELESLYLEELMTTRDAQEGLAAFLEKRAPRWEDR